LDEDISLKNMLAPFPKQADFLYNLFETKRVLKDYDFKSEFSDALLKIERQYAKIQANTLTDEVEIVKDIQRRKGKTDLKYPEV
jgi:DNA primase